MDNRKYGGSSRGGSRDYGSSGPREMTKVTCSDGGKECEVPFKPTEGRPVYLLRVPAQAQAASLLIELGDCLPTSPDFSRTTRFSDRRHRHARPFGAGSPEAG